MKKRLMSLLSLFLMAGVFMTGCSAKETTAEADDPIVVDFQNINISEALDVAELYASEKNNAEADDASADNLTDEDSLEAEELWSVYLTDEETAENDKWMKCYLVKQDNQMYVLDFTYPHADDTMGGFLLHSNIPAFTYRDGDSLRYYYDDGINKPDKLRLVKVNPPKGALNIRYGSVFDNSGMLTLKEFDTYNVLEDNSVIVDKNGNEIGDVQNNMYNLNLGETYSVTVEDESGTYKEEMTADWLFYPCDDFNDEIIIHPDLSDKKYATYDLSSLEPGYYCIIWGTYVVIEIK